MAQTSQISAWIALFMGLYLLAAAVGELRSPNGWWAMIKELERSPGLRFLMGVVALVLGATIYLVNPWRTDDWLAVAVSVMGGVVIAEGLLIIAMGDRFLRFSRGLLGRVGNIWAGLTALTGAALVLVAMARLQDF